MSSTSRVERPHFQHALPVMATSKPPAGSGTPDQNDECLRVAAMDSQSVREEQNTLVSAVGPRPVPSDHALYHATSGLLSGHDTTAVLRQVVQAARALTNADGVAILLYD